MIGREIAESEAALAKGASDSAEGLCTAISWADRLVTVNQQGALLQMPWVGHPPWVGDRVRVITAGQRPFCEAVYGSPLGTYVSAAGNIATVTGDDGVTYEYPYPNGASYSVGHRLLLDHAHRAVVMRYSTDPVTAVPGGPSAPTSTSGSAWFYPTDSGNYRSGVFSSQYAEVSINRTAAYWYGTQIANTIPDSATITRAEIHLVELWDNVPGTPTQMGTHTQASRGAEPTITGTINVSGTGVYALGSFANSLKTGSVYGLGFRKNTGWRRFATYATSGAIYMQWTV